MIRNAGITAFMKLRFLSRVFMPIREMEFYALTTEGLLGGCFGSLEHTSFLQSSSNKDFQVHFPQTEETIPFFPQQRFTVDSCIRLK